MRPARLVISRSADHKIARLPDDRSRAGSYRRDGHRTNEGSTMNARSLGRLAPLAGLAYAVATVVGNLVIDTFPDSDSSVADLATYYSTRHAHVAAGGMIFAWASILLAIFGVALWSRARDAGAHAAVAAAILVATAVAIVGNVQSASTYWILGHISTENGVSPAALQAWHVAGAEGGLGAGLALFLLAAGAAGLAAGAVPRWLAWPAIVLGLLQMTPIGFFASLLFLLWAAVTGVVLVSRSAPRGAVAPAGI
jgi:hypothetical protein